MWEIIQDLVRDGDTIFLTTQYLAEADQLADRIAVMDNGKIVAGLLMGTPVNDNAMNAIVWCVGHLWSRRAFEKDRNDDD
jgi:ABC-type sugar transport system ATPase subunit